MANTCREAIVEIFADESGVLETKQVINSINTRYPNCPWKPNTISAHLIGLSVNHPSSIHHPHLRRYGFLVSLGNSRYRKGNPQEIPPVYPAPTEISVTPDDLGRWRRNIIRLLNALWGRPSQPEGVVARILRLARDGNIPRTTSALLVMIVEMRNAVEYEETQLSPLEKETVWSAWRAVAEWARTKGIILES